ncbi:hypothetical protein [Terribacillus saccharophilus]|nr:hypothetical protein [Terribacillus saccharophilus]
MYFTEMDIFYAELKRLEDEYKRCPEPQIRSLIHDDILLIEQAIATAEGP